MNYLKLQIPPGVRWHGTAYQSSDRWRDANLMRWDQGAMMPVGGWVRFIDSADDPQAVNITASFNDTSVPREAHSWFLDDATGADGAGYFLAVATTNHVYTMNGFGEVRQLTAGKDIAGSETPRLNKGYGGGLYGKQSYGTPRQTEGQTKLPATTWTLDNYGEDLMAVSTSDRQIWRWQPQTDTFDVLEESPRCLSLVATEERFLFALGAEKDGTINVRRVAWCDRESPEVWELTEYNEAGGFELQTDGAIRCGIRVRGRTLILTTTDAHVAQYSGPPLVYGFQQVGKNCGIASDRAVAATGAGAFWMGRDGFYAYDGSAVRELPCEVTDRVFRFLDSTFMHNIFAVANAKHNEITWFYTSTQALGLETTVDGNVVIKKVNDRYVTYDYAQNIWSIGEITRHAAVDSGVFNDPIWLDSTCNVWRHEISNAAYDKYQRAVDRWDGWTAEPNSAAAFTSGLPYPDNLTLTGGTWGNDSEMLLVGENSGLSGAKPFWEAGAKFTLKSIRSIPDMPAQFYGEKKPVKMDLRLYITNWNEDYWEDGNPSPICYITVREAGRVIHENTVFQTSSYNNSYRDFKKDNFIVSDPDAEITLEITPSQKFIDAKDNILMRSQTVRYDVESRAWAETGPISIGAGDQVINATQVLTDSGPAGRVELEFKTRFQPQGEEISFGPYKAQPQTDVRFTGRQMRMRVNVVNDDSGSHDVRIGDMRVLIGSGGRR